MTIAGNRARFLVGALILSVCLNLFGAAVYGARHFWRPDRSDEPPFARMVERAPEAAQPALRRAFAAHEQALTERFEEVRAAREAVRALLRGESADTAALTSAFVELRARWAAAAAERDAVFIEAVPEMPAEARAELAETWGRR